MAGCAMTLSPAVILVIVLRKYLVKGLAFSGLVGAKRDRRRQP